MKFPPFPILLLVAGLLALDAPISGLKSAPLALDQTQESAAKRPPGRRLVYQPHAQLPHRFQLQKSLQAIDVSVAKLLVCVKQIHHIPGSILAFKHLHEKCYAEYNVTFTAIEQVRTWDNRVIFKYIASQKNLRALAEVSSIESDSADGVPFHTFFQAVKTDYKKFDFRYYRSHYEAQAKAVAQFYEQNSIGLQQVAAAFRKVEGAYEFEAAYADFRNQVHAFESINQVIDAHCRQRLRVDFDQTAAEEMEPTEDELESQTDQDSDSSDYGKGAVDEWQVENQSGEQKWLPNPKQEQILNFDGVNYQVRDPSVGTRPVLHGWDADVAEGNVLPIETKSGAEQRWGRPDLEIDDNAGEDSFVDPVEVPSPYIRGGAQAQKVFAGDQQNLSTADFLQSQIDALGNAKNDAAGHVQTISEIQSQNPTVPTRIEEHVVLNPVSVTHHESDEEVGKQIEQQAQAQNQMVSAFSSTLSQLLSSLGGLLQKVVQKQMEAPAPVPQAQTVTLVLPEASKGIDQLQRNIPPSNFQIPAAEFPDDEDSDQRAANSNNIASQATLPESTDDEPDLSSQQAKAEYNAIRAAVTMPVNAVPEDQEKVAFDPVTSSLIRTPSDSQEAAIQAVKKDISQLGFGDPSDMNEPDYDEELSANDGDAGIPGSPTLNLDQSHHIDNPLPIKSSIPIRPNLVRPAHTQPLSQVLNLPQKLSETHRFQHQTRPVLPSRISSKTDTEAKQFAKRLHRESSPQGRQNGIFLRRAQPAPQEVPKNVFGRYIRKTLLPLDEPVSYPVNKAVEEYARKKQKCKDEKTQIKRQILHDDQGLYPTAVRQKLIDELVTPEADQRRRAEPPNPVEINRRIDRFSRASILEDRAYPIGKYSHKLEEDERFDNVDLDLEKELLRSAKAEKGRKKVLSETNLGVWKDAKRHKVLLDANGNYAPRKQRVCPCRYTTRGWEMDIEGVVPGVRIFHDNKTGPCRNCDKDAATEQVVLPHVDNILGGAKSRRLTLVKRSPKEERRLSDLRAKFRGSLPI